MAVRYRHQDAPRIEDYHGNIQAWARAFGNWANEISRHLEEITAGEQPIRSVYSVENDTPSRSLDVSGIDAAGVANVLAAVIRDLARKSILRTKGS